MASPHWTAITALLVVWLIGASMSLGGSLIHFALAAALVIMGYNLLTRGIASDASLAPTDSYMV